MSTYNRFESALRDHDLQHAFMTQARARAQELREEALQSLWDHVGVWLGERRVAVQAWLRRRAEARADAQSWVEALRDPRVRAEVLAIRDHAQSLAEVAELAARARQTSALQPSLIVQPVARPASKPRGPGRARHRRADAYRTRMPGWAPAVGSST